MTTTPMTPEEERALVESLQRRIEQLERTMFPPLPGPKSSPRPRGHLRSVD